MKLTCTFRAVDRVHLWSFLAKHFSKLDIVCEVIRRHHG
jgi:hypothetical protein